MKASSNVPARAQQPAQMQQQAQAQAQTARAQYDKAYAVCLEGQGYQVR